MRYLLLVLLGVAYADPVAAHDFWLQPRQFWVSPGAVSPATLQVGHGQYRQRSPIPAKRVVALRSVGPNGAVDQRSGLHLGEPDEDVELRFADVGVHLVALETNNAMSTLPAIRFNDYLQAEGLTAVIDWRDKTGTSQDPSRELYSRRAKMLVQVGPVDARPQPQVTRPIGLSLEIVPERNPYALELPAQLPIQVLFDGEPLAGALVKLTDLDADAAPIETHVTDASGHAAFTVSRKGSWLLNVIWSTPVAANRAANSVTTFSSLSFGYPAETH